MYGLIVDGSTCDANWCTGRPWLSHRNFWKFHGTAFMKKAFFKKAKSAVDYGDDHKSGRDSRESRTK
jgi:hypothetical protein